jgi:hypothetical protein
MVALYHEDLCCLTRNELSKAEPGADAIRYGVDNAGEQKFERNDTHVTHRSLSTDIKLDVERTNRYVGQETGALCPYASTCTTQNVVWQIWHGKEVIMSVSKHQKDRRTGRYRYSLRKSYVRSMFFNRHTQSLCMNSIYRKFSTAISTLDVPS